MSDNGSAFRARRSASALRRLGTAHKRSRPYTPRTNGKAERFAQTSPRGWADAKAYETSEQRHAELGIFLFRCNWQRPHRRLDAQPAYPRTTC